MFFKSMNKHLFITYVILNKIGQNNINISDILFLKINGMFIHFLRLNIFNVLYSEINSQF